MVKPLDQDHLPLANEGQKRKSQIAVNELNALLEEEGKANTHILSISTIRQKQTNNQMQF